MFRTLTQGLGLALLCFIANTSFAESVQFAVPYYMEPQSKLNVHLQVVQEALKQQQIDITPLYLPSSKISQIMTDQKIGGGFLEDNSSIHQFFSSNAYVYHLKPVAVSLKSKDLKIKNTEDLKQYRVIGFDNATKLLGEFYRRMTTDNEQYQERAHQDAQVKLLFLKHVDVIILADSIFKHYKTQLPKAYEKMEVVYHPILQDKDTLVQPVFREKRVREAFEAGMKQLRAKGILKDILKNA